MFCGSPKIFDRWHDLSLGSVLVIMEQATGTTLSPIGQGSVHQSDAWKGILVCTEAWAIPAPIHGIWESGSLHPDSQQQREMREMECVILIICSPHLIIILIDM